MKQPVSIRLKITVALLLVALVLQGSAMFTFTIVDNIVHKDLYRYGLQFDLGWARPYWDSSGLFSMSIAVAMILTIISIGFVLGFRKKNRLSAIFAGYLLPFVIISFNLFSILIFQHIVQIINMQLYSYGLQLSFEWANPLLTYSILLYTMIGIATAITIALPLLIYFATQEKVVAGKLGTITIERRPAVTNQTSRPISFILITTGTAALLMSIFYVFAILAFVGLGLVFWGILFIFIRTEEYTKKTLLSTVGYPEIATLNRIIDALNFKGKPLYLPPRYFTNPESLKAYIPKQNGPIPSPERIRSQEKQVFIDSPPGLLVTSPGLELTKLFERSLGTNFTRVDVQYLQQNLPKLIIEDLEIAQNLSIEPRNNIVQVKIENPVYGGLVPEKDQQGSAFGSAIGGAIACALAKATGKPIVVEKQQNSQDGKNATIEYRIITEEAQNKP